MSRSWSVWVLAAFSLLALPALAKRDHLTVDEVLDKNIQAVGAPERIAAIQTLVARGSEEVSTTSGLKDTRAVETYYKAPNRRAVRIQSKERGLERYFGCDGTEVWRYSRRFHTVRDWPINPVYQHECVALDLFPIPLRALKAELKVLYGEKVRGRRVFVILAKIPRDPWRLTYYVDLEKDSFVSAGQGGDKVELAYFVDAETFLLLRIESGNTIPRGRWDFDDYRDVHGVKIPFREVYETSESRTVTTIQDLQVNVPIEDNLLRKPTVAPKGK